MSECMHVCVSVCEPCCLGCLPPGCVPKHWESFQPPATLWSIKQYGKWMETMTLGNEIKPLFFSQRRVEVHDHLNGSRIIFSDEALPVSGSRHLFMAPDITQEVVVISPGLPTPPSSPFHFSSAPAPSQHKARAQP